METVGSPVRQSFVRHFRAIPDRPIVFVLEINFQKTQRCSSVNRFMTFSEDNIQKSGVEHGDIMVQI